MSGVGVPGTKDFTIQSATGSKLIIDKVFQKLMVDFAVVRLQAEPAKTPSFWTKTAEIEQFYAKIRDFWLPASNHTVTSIRLGGRAELTIIHDDYLITNAGPVGSLSQLATSPASANHRSRILTVVGRLGGEFDRFLRQCAELALPECSRTIREVRGRQR